MFIIDNLNEKSETNEKLILNWGWVEQSPVHMESEFPRIAHYLQSPQPKSFALPKEWFFVKNFWSVSNENVFDFSEDKPIVLSIAVTESSCSKH